MITKLEIKSDKIMPFGGIFSVIREFSTIESLVDTELGMRSRLTGYQYGEILRAMMCNYLCGGDRIEYKEMPNGNIRAFDASADDKRGVAEMQIADPQNPAQTLTCAHVQELVERPAMRIRKLTPREYFRLMDVDDDRIDVIQAAGVSKSQQYKLAGNSIVVSCLYHIFHKMYIDTEVNEPQQLTLF